MSQAKLSFIYGPVSASKSMRLLASAKQYRVQKKNVALIKPQLDNRFGVDFISSRVGLSEKADFLIAENTKILDLPIFQPNETDEPIECLFVDEVQFFSEAQIDELRDITAKWNIPVMCYGLRTDFRGKLFPGSKRLFELGDYFEEIEIPCQFCANKAIMNLKHRNGKADLDGPIIQLGAEESYFPTCHQCYSSKTNPVAALPEMKTPMDSKKRQREVSDDDLSTEETQLTEAAVVTPTFSLENKENILSRKLVRLD